MPVCICWRLRTSKQTCFSCFRSSLFSKWGLWVRSRWLGLEKDQGWVCLHGRKSTIGPKMRWRKIVPSSPRCCWSSRRFRCRCSWWISASRIFTGGEECFDVEHQADDIALFVLESGPLTATSLTVSVKTMGRHSTTWLTWSTTPSYRRRLASPSVLTTPARWDSFVRERSSLTYLMLKKISSPHS